jgi:DNA-binding Lrp family transcriptional regulator
MVCLYRIKTLQKRGYVELIGLVLCFLMDFSFLLEMIGAKLAIYLSTQGENRLGLA